MQIGSSSAPELALSRQKYHLRRDMPYYLMLLIPVAYFIIFCFIPMYGIIIGFQDFKVGSSFFGGNVKWVGLKWFEMYFRSPFFGRTIGNTIWLTVLSLVILFPLPIVLAIVFNEVQHRHFRGFVQTVSYMPYFLSTTIVVGILSNLLSPNGGLVNTVIAHFGGEPVDFMGSAAWFRPLYLISEAWEYGGFNSIIYIAAIAGISPELYEAAYVDGSTRVKNIFYITLPSIAPTIIILLLLQLGSLFSVGYEKIILMYSPQTYETADVISTYVYRNGIGNQKFSFATAIGMFNSVINIVVLLTANAIARKVSETSLW